MSRIADLIIEQGRVAAAARQQSGAAWGQAAQNIGAAPGQAIASYQEKQARDQAQALAASREARESAAAAQEQQVRGLQINAATTAAKQQSALDAIWGSGIIKEDGSIDKEKAQTLARQAGMPHLVPAIIDQANKWDASTADLNAKKDAAKRSAMELQSAQQDQLGVDAADMKRATPDAGTFSLWIAKRAKDGIIPPDEANTAIEAAHQDPTAIGSYLDRKIQGSKSAQAQRTAGLKEVPKEGTLVNINDIDPATGKPRVVASGAPSDETVTVKTVENGKNVERVVPKSEAVKHGAYPSQPSASVVIHNENAKALNLPTWATSDERPAGPDANKLDATIRMTPNGLHQAALNYIANGQFPPTGRGTDPIAVAQRAAITSKVGAIAAASGMDEPALRAFYKSNASSLTQQQKMLDSVQGFMATADKNADLLDASLKKIPDIGIPIFNKPLRAFEKDVLGDKELSQFGTYLKSVQNEYARIISQPNLAGQLTDSARQEAEHLIDPKATVPQILASIQALKNEGNNRLVSVGEQIKRIQQRMGAGGGPSTPPTTSATDPLGIRR